MCPETSNIDKENKDHSILLSAYMATLIFIKLNIGLSVQKNKDACCS